MPPGPDDVSVHLIEGDAAGAVIPELYERMRLTRPGMLSRSEAWWEHRRFYDPEHYRGGASSRRYAVARRDGRVDGYVIFRQKEKWDDFVPDGTINVIEMMAVDDGARRALWRFLLNIDLFPNVDWWNAPIDEPVVWEAGNRRMVRRRISDTLWVRILDVPAALAGRSYERNGTFVLDVTDESRPETAGRYRLEVVDGRAEVARTDEASDVGLDVRELGALYLGGRNAVVLARAGRIDGSPHVLRRLNDVFRTTEPPWCPEVF